jgi:hypothetical protein
MGRKGAEITQTLYAHMNKRKKQVITEQKRISE